MDDQKNFGRIFLLSRLMNADGPRLLMRRSPPDACTSPQSTTAIGVHWSMTDDGTLRRVRRDFPSGAASIAAAMSDSVPGVCRHRMRDRLREPELPRC
jgi:hypothetical protein